MRTRTVRLHGSDVCLKEAGEPGRPLLVLLHGIAGSSATWESVGDRLAAGHHVLAPDLLGHGLSATEGDYSLGGHASLLRDLLAVLGEERATFVGHSLGGGVALQFAYQYPDQVERLALVSSGGLGRSVSPVLRAATLPGAGVALPLLAHRRLMEVGAAVCRAVDALPLPVAASAGAREWGRHYASLSEAGHRRAFVHTARGVMDTRGQRLSARERLHLAADVPTLLVWGARDSIIPVGHGRRAAAEIPGSRLEVFERSGHFPHTDEPARFAQLLSDFVATTEPARLDTAEVRRRLAAAVREDAEDRADAPLPAAG